MQHRGPQQAQNLEKSEIHLLFKKVRERRKSRENLNEKTEPEIISEYLEDWISKFVRDGYAIEKILEMILQNSFQRRSRSWLLRFLTNLKGNLNKRSLKPRICLPRIYVEKDEVETKEFLRQSYSFLENNQKILNLIMKTGYLWFNLSWEQIEQQLKRNRLQTKKIRLEDGEHPKTVGVLFHSKQMRSSFNCYGDCLYIVHFRALLGIQQNGQEIVRDLVIGVVVTEFKLCLVIFIALYEDCKKVEKTDEKSEGKQVNQVDQKTGQNKKQDDNLEIDSVVYFVLSSVLREFIYKPMHILYFFRQSDTKDYNFRSKYFYSQPTQTNKLNGSVICSTIIRASSNQNVKKLSKQQATQKLTNFIGIYSCQNNDHMAQIFSFINNNLTNHQFCFESVIWKIRDRCQLVTYLLKIVLCLEQQSIYKRDPASQLTSFGVVQKINKENLSDPYFEDQIQNLKQRIYAKPILKHILQNTKDTSNYALSQPQFYQYSKSIRIMVASNKVREEKYQLLFYIEWSRWECSCFYIYHTGIPCCHILKVLQLFKGQISYYIHDRWKNPSPRPSTKQRNNRMKEKEVGCPVTNNKGLMRLATLYRKSFLTNLI